MPGEPVVLYEWPDAQVCFECEHGVPLIDYGDIIKLSDNSAICLKNCMENFNGKCPKFKDAELEDVDEDCGIDLGGMFEDDGVGKIENDD